MNTSDAMRALQSSGPAVEESVLRRRVTFGRRIVVGKRPEEKDAGKT